MIRKLLLIALFTCLGLALTGVAFFATYENRYQEILRMKKESERIPAAERKAKAKAIAAKMYEKYETTKYLSVEADEAYYWCRQGALLSHLPMNLWRRLKVADFQMAMTPQNLKTQIVVEGKPLFTFILKDGVMSEWKRPWNGVPGQQTEYPMDDREGTRLTGGVAGAVLCVSGLYRISWIGPNPHWPDLWKRRIEVGEWLGTAEVDGSRCDVVLCQEFSNWFVYYMAPDGKLAMWIVVDHTEAPVVEVRIDHFMNFRTDSIPLHVFSPSNALREEAENWRTLTEAEAQSERETE